MTWLSVIITPILLAFEMMDETLPSGVKQANLKAQILWLVWLIDVSWCIEIILNFFTATPTKRSFKKISKAYLKGNFIFDIAATIPPMLFLQENAYLNRLKFLRLVHFFEMFTPIMTLLDCIMVNSIARKRSDTFQLIVLFTATLLFGHFAACFWISLGTSDNGWLSQLQLTDTNFATYEPMQVYIFS